MIPGLAEFEGGWTIARRIDDRRAGRSGRFEGRARFAPGGGGLLYEEEGMLTLGAAAPLYATRRYIWRAAEDGGIDVFFDDSRPFHSLGGVQGCQASHWCDPDTYRVAYDFSRWPLWRATWDVSGPAKDYTMVSDYAAGPRHG